jgi:hypothetical protein
MSPNQRFAALAVLAATAFLSSTCVYAQSAGSDEAVGPTGAIEPHLALTPEQRSEIYHAVLQQPVRGSGPGITAAIGARVPPSAALQALPDQAALGSAALGLLKYAMVANDVVLVDPIRMRVVDVIHRGVRQ